MRHTSVEFKPPYHNLCIHDFTMTDTRALLMGGILKTLSWAYIKYCQLIS